MTLELISKYISYNPDTGDFTWIALTHPSVSKIKIGDKAGVILPHGYVRIVFKQKKLYAHRLAWLFMTGKWPEKQIDHINRRRSDNRYLNLREACQSLQEQNKGLSTANTSGVKGVYFLKRTGKWSASIGINGKSNHLGTFENKDDAAQARREAEKKHFKI